MSGFYDIAVQSIDGSPDLLGKLRGKVALAVNVASRCGLTPQYEGLEKLQQELQGQDFTVIGFPCNQFGAQEPGTEQQIVQFCQTTFDVTFPMSSKLEVNGSSRHPLYNFLTSPDTGVSGEITWNFEKFLIGRDGKAHTLEIEPVLGIPLNVGCGYGADPDWTHGTWRGEGFVEGAVYDHDDPAVSGRAAFSLVDHVARATFDGQEGWGIFEHGAIGRHDPSGFADLTSVAP